MLQLSVGYGLQAVTAIMCHVTCARPRHVRTMVHAYPHTHRLMTCTPACGLVSEVVLVASLHAGARSGGSGGASFP